tara:strand:- start:2353 stop:2604 length:252 start_codon:yes stop_codon:yes gene_type:complete
MTELITIFVLVIILFVLAPRLVESVRITNMVNAGDFERLHAYCKKNRVNAIPYSKGPVPEGAKKFFRSGEVKAGGRFIMIHPL